MSAVSPEYPPGLEEAPVDEDLQDALDFLLFEDPEQQQQQEHQEHQEHQEQQEHPAAAAAAAGGGHLSGTKRKKDNIAPKKKGAVDEKQMEAASVYLSKVQALFDSLNSGDPAAFENISRELLIPDVVVTEQFVGAQPENAGLGRRIQGVNLWIDFMRLTIDAIPDGVLKILEIRLRRIKGLNVLLCSYLFGGTALSKVKVNKAGTTQPTVTIAPLSTPDFPLVRGTMSLTFNDQDKVQQIDLMQSFEVPGSNESADATAKPPKHRRQ